MKCSSCDVSIDPKFKAAIKKNECPACSGSILPPEKLAAMNSLKELLDKNIVVKGVNTDALVSLIVANFDLRQLYREEKVDGLESKSDNEDITEEPEKAKKTASKSDSGDDLATLREEIYKDAERAQFGLETQLEYGDPELDGGADVDFDFDTSNEVFDSEKNIDPKTMAARLKDERDKALRKARMESGVGGFRRSD